MRGLHTTTGRARWSRWARRGGPHFCVGDARTPLRDGNRDRLFGLLTERAAKTLLFYCSETNQHLYHWLMDYCKAHPIPRDGKFEDISGEPLARETLPSTQPRPFRASSELTPSPHPFLFHLRHKARRS